MSQATRAAVRERLSRGQYTCSGKHCGPVDQPNTVCAACRLRSANYRRANKEAGKQKGDKGGKNSDKKGNKKGVKEGEKSTAAAATGGVKTGKPKKGQAKKN